MCKTMANDNTYTCDSVAAAGAQIASFTVNASDGRMTQTSYY